MRKLIYLFAVVVLGALAASCTSCSNDAPWGVEYSLNSNGKTDAAVDFTFVNGEFSLDGDANYLFTWSNAKDSAVFAGAKPLSESLLTGDRNTLQAANYVNSWLDSQFRVVNFTGHYDIYIKGYVKETKTQITFSVDRHFSN